MSPSCPSGHLLIRHLLLILPQAKDKLPGELGRAPAWVTSLEMELPSVLALHEKQQLQVGVSGQETLTHIPVPAHPPRLIPVDLQRTGGPADLSQLPAETAGSRDV